MLIAPPSDDCTTNVTCAHGICTAHLGFILDEMAETDADPLESLAEQSASRLPTIVLTWLTMHKAFWRESINEALHYQARAEMAFPKTNLPKKQLNQAWQQRFDPEVLVKMCLFGF